MCTYTNVAVDNLVESLVASGVRPLRVGAAGRVKESLAAHSLEAKIDAHPAKPAIDKLKDEISKLVKRIDDLEKDIGKAMMSSGDPKKVEKLMVRKRMFARAFH